MFYLTKSKHIEFFSNLNATGNLADDNQCKFFDQLSKAKRCETLTRASRLRKRQKQNQLEKKLKSTAWKEADTNFVLCTGGQNSLDRPLADNQLNKKCY